MYVRAWADRKGLPFDVELAYDLELRDLGKIDEENVPAGWDFEEFNKISAGLHEMAEHLRHEVVEEDEVIVDFTSGQKPNTVAAAMMTANKHVFAQYVQTNFPWKPLEYDLVTTPPHLPSIEHLPNFFVRIFRIDR